MRRKAQVVTASRAASAAAWTSGVNCWIGQYGVDVLADEPGGAPRQVESLFDRVDRVEHLLEASHLNAGGNR
jgi:hypothetical protein